MPIRFRCAYCNQLMGIARRKAGTVVSCPTCSGQVVVPKPEGAEAEEKSPPPAPGPKAAPDLFERSDFGQELFGQSPGGRGRAAPVRSGGFLPVPQPSAGAVPPLTGGFDVEPATGPPKGAYAAPAPSPPGIFLTTGKVTVLSVLVVLLIGVAFFAGMLVGRS
jgi:phage FluMu protein Com